MWCDEGNEKSLEGHCGLTEKEDLIRRWGVDLKAAVTMCLNQITEHEFKLAGEGGGQSDTVEGTVKSVWAPSVTPHAFNRY